MATTKSSASTSFRFDAHDHTYWLGQQLVQNITGLLTVSGEIDDRWFTEESSVLGKAVHRLTAEHDMGALAVDDVELMFKGYIAGHSECMSIIEAEFTHIEVPFIEPRRKFAGTPDRVGRFYGAAGVLEVKSGEVSKAHRIQTAMQAILVAPILRLPPRAIHRYVEYVDERGRFRVDQHLDMGDFKRAEEILEKYV